MGRLARERIPPYYAQVQLSDAAHFDYPDWGDGTADVVASDSCIAVATRPDHLGDVEVEVWSGATEGETEWGESVWTGRLTIGDGGAVFGTTVGNQLVPVQLPSGQYAVGVFTLPGPRLLAVRVIFSVEPVS
jgi:hypothetical protein